MARRSQCSNPGDNPLDPNYLPPHYREEYRLAIDALIEENLEGYYKFLQTADVVDFLATPEIQYIQSSVQVPQQSLHPEQQFLDTGADGSSDTYWPIHSDLDVPGLDLGWPQMHHFIEPTEVTTLINPPEGDMPNIKEQARRLIKNARQVIAIVMDMFSDVDIFADILNAAMRNVAVYILLDEQNAEYFVNMVTNCRVNLQSIQFLRVRTVSGNQYKCRSGKSFKGQMMDRFLLTDCRAVLSGNYSFMWSFEKLHRCMAHLFLGQLVSTFDEEFRVLYAQSQPLIIENVLAQMEDLNPAPKRQYPSDRTALYREPRKFRDTGFQEERLRHSYDERTDVDWRLMPLKSQDPLHGPSDIYSRFPSQQPRMDPSLDQGPCRLPMLENPAFKRHSYAEGASDRFSYPFLHQQGAPEPENQGRLFHRGQQPYPGPGRGPETDYSSYDKFWNQDFHNADQYSESGLPPDLISSDTFDPVLNYLSSTRNVDFDQSSDKLLPTADLPYSSPQPRRHSFGQPYVNQTSPTPSNPGDQKQLFQEPNIDRKDPTVKQGLRNWRISSFLSAHDNPTDEGLPQGPHQGPDSFEEPFNPLQQTGTGIDLSVPKIPNVREFKIPATPRASQIPSYTKALVREQPKKLPDETTEVAAEVKTTPTPSESSSTTDVEKVEEAEQKEPKVSLRFRDDSFRRKYNAAAPRSSRLRSSLIFSSLDQHAPPDKTASGQQDEESDKNDAEQTKGSQGLGQRRPLAREWSRYIKSASFNTSLTDASKPNEGDSKADVKDQPKVEVSKDQQPLKQSDAEQADPSLSMAQSKPPEAELPKTDQPVQAPKPLLTTSAFVDMNDPETRLIFFKELAAKRKAAKAAEADKSKDKAPVKPLPDLKNNTTVKKEEPDPKEDSEKAVSASPSEASSEKNQTTDDAGKTASTEACKSVSVPLEISDNTDKSGSLVKNDTSTTQSCREEQTSMSTDSEKIELKNSQPETSLRVSTDTESLSNPPEDLSKPAEKESSLNHPPTPTNATPANIASPVKGTDESENSSCESTSKESSTLTPSPVEEQPSAALDSSPVQFESTIAEPPPLSEQQTESDLSLSYPSIKNSDHVLSDSHVSPSPATSSPAPVSTPGKTLSSDVTPEESNSVPSSNILSPISNETEAQESVSSSQTEMTSEADAAHVESNIPPDMCASSAEPDTSSLQSTTNTNLEESCAPTPLETDGLKSDKNSVAEQSEVPDSSVDVKADTTPPPLSPSSTKVDSPVLSDLKTSSKPDQIETVTTPSSPEHSSSETHLPVSEDSTSNTSQPATDAPPQHAPTQTTPPSELNLTGSVIPTPVETVPRSSPLTESVGSSLCPEAEKTGTNSSTLRIPSDALEQITTDPSETPELPSTETSTPTEPTSKVPTEPTPEPVSSESQLSESTVPAENSKIDNQSEESKEPELSGPDEKTTEDAEATKNVCNSTKAESVISEKTNDLVSQNKSSETSEITSDEVVPLSPQSKQPKSIQSRYHASTANVLSSSNLRDDTKLLLEQISANSQSRNETNKEAPVTDDEKEDEADKNAKREKEREIRTINRGQPKTTEEREKLLERIQSMRKERKVYSRFEMAP